ncbi:hypothetical protein B0H12DRAFT_1126989 [Mycena haematopus]|nr:hypothetical protein B0H12DRAFT_1126989 [Mycena haematopus]
MGASSSRASTARSEEIDRQLEKESVRYKRESSKSTLVNHMKVAHEGFTTEELLAFRSTIHKNVIDSARAIVLALRASGLDAASSRCDIVCEV